MKTNSSSLHGAAGCGIVFLDGWRAVSDTTGRIWFIFWHRPSNSRLWTKQVLLCCKLICLHHPKIFDARDQYRHVLFILKGHTWRPPYNWCPWENIKKKAALIKTALSADNSVMSWIVCVIMGVVAFSEAGIIDLIFLSPLLIADQLLLRSNKNDTY